MIQITKKATKLVALAALMCSAALATEIVVPHAYWETGNYSSNAASGYANITTNTVHWMKAHVDTSTNSPSFTVTAWHEWGWFNLYWKERLTDEVWERVVWCRDQHWGINTYRIFMHPESSLTKRMLESDTSFFSQSPKGPYEYRDRYGHARVHEKIYSIDMTGFFPPVIQAPATASISTNTVDLVYTNVMGMESTIEMELITTNEVAPAVSSAPPPIPGG